MSDRKLEIRLTEFEVTSENFKAKGRWEEPTGADGEAHRRWAVHLSAKDDARRTLWSSGLGGQWRFMELPEAQEFAAILLEHAEDDNDALIKYFEARDKRLAELSALETETYVQHLEPVNP